MALGGGSLFQHPLLAELGEMPVNHGSQPLNCSHVSVWEQVGS